MASVDSATKIFEQPAPSGIVAAPLTRGEAVQATRPEFVRRTAEARQNDRLER
jgi:hypothetical protein